MISINNTLMTAQDFIEYLNGLYGKKQDNKKTIDDALGVWYDWESQGISYPNNIVDMALDPFKIYDLFFQDIIMACDLKEIDISQVYFYLVRINNLNAYANTMPNDDKIIVFDENLISFFTTFSVAAIVAVYSNPSEIESNEIEQFIISTLAGFYDREQTCQQNKKYAEKFITIIKKDYKLTEIGSYLSIAFTIFVICHELSHHLLGHATKKHSFIVKNTQREEKKIPLNKPSHEEEFAADNKAYQLFLELIEKSHRVKSAKLSQALNRAPLLFFEIIHTVELFAQKKAYQKIESDTHPPCLERKNHLLNGYKHHLPSEGLAIYTKLMMFFKYIKTRI